MVEHGQRPYFALGWFIAFWLVGALAFWIGDDAGLMSRYTEAHCTGRYLKPSLYSLDLLAPTELLSLDFHQKSCFEPTYPAKTVPVNVFVYWLCDACYFSQPLLGSTLILFLVRHAADS
jgi:hypothetical protein